MPRKSRIARSKARHSLASYTTKQALADRAWWYELKRYFPQWTLYGFSYKHSATFCTDLNYREELHITGDQRDQIVNAIEKEKA